MKVFKITRKKVTFGGVETTKQEYKRIIKKENEEEGSGKSPSSSFSFWFNRRREAGANGFIRARGRAEPRRVNLASHA
jgi:hypothetical protein